MRRQVETLTENSVCVPIVIIITLLPIHFGSPLEVVSHFFLEIWKFQKIPIPFRISTQNESVRLPLFVKSYKMAVSLESPLHWLQNDLP